ncbi:MAG: universal stress protein [Pseudomonadota bacterium]
MSFSCILVPIDFSDDSLTAYQTALDLFVSPQRTLILLHAVDNRVDDLAQDQGGGKALEERRRQLASLGNRRKAEWKDVVTLIEGGKPIDLIISTAKQMAVDLIVMGPGTSTGLVKGLFGSTTYDVARRVKCSVMISKPDASRA